MKIGTYVRKLREEKNLTLTEASVISGISLAALARLEQNKSRYIHAKTYAKLSEMYGVPAGELMKCSFKGHPHWSRNNEEKQETKHDKHDNHELIIADKFDTHELQTFMKYMYKLSQLSANSRATLFELIDKLS